MNTKQPLAVLGGDQRQMYMSRTLAAMGYEVYTWGLFEWCVPVPPTVHACSCWQDAVAAADTVILPLPATVDGVFVNTPAALPGALLRLSSLLEAMSGKHLLGGRLPPALCTAAEGQDIRVTDYYTSEILQLKNALPTAEGAISIAMQRLPVTVQGSEVAVVGYGRIGALLAARLEAWGAHVSVFARRGEARALAELSHHTAFPLSKQDGYAALCALSPRCRVLFNTVPVRVMTEDVLSQMPRGCLLIELASMPGGIDSVAAQRLGFDYVLGSALPGKHTPESAGVILGESLVELL